MARKSRTGVLKRQREMKKAEKAALKREKRDTRSEQDSAGGDQVATAEDLAGYGFSRDEDDERADGSRSRPR
jgi:phosphopantothenoylcysteine synthetase/decarboxylase